MYVSVAVSAPSDLEPLAGKELKKDTGHYYEGERSRGGRWKRREIALMRWQGVSEVKARECFSLVLFIGD